MERSVRVEDVARVAGVSPITVSRALRTPEKVKAATLERVLEAVRETGYHINSIASSLRSGQSQFVLVFVASLQNQHFAAAMQGVLDVFEQSRFHLMFAQMGYDEDVSAERIRSMLPFRPAATLFTGVVRNEGARAYLRSLNVPVMEMWGETDDPVDMLVSSPIYRGGELLGQHLGEQGFRRIAYVGHTNSRSSVRIDGVNAALRQYGCEISLLISIEGTGEMEHGVAAFDRIQAQMPDVDAMMFGTDVVAAGALVRAQELGIRVPEQLGITGYGDLFFAGHTQPGLTSIRTSPHEMGQAAGRMLLSRLAGHISDERIIQVPVHLEARGTTLRRKT